MECSSRIPQWQSRYKNKYPLSLNKNKTNVNLRDKDVQKKKSIEVDIDKEIQVEETQSFVLRLSDDSSDYLSDDNDCTRYEEDLEDKENCETKNEVQEIIVISDSESDNEPVNNTRRNIFGNVESKVRISDVYVLSSGSNSSQSRTSPACNTRSPLEYNKFSTNKNFQNKNDKYFTPQYNGSNYMNQTSGGKNRTCIKKNETVRSAISESIVTPKERITKKDVNNMLKNMKSRENKYTPLFNARRNNECKNIDDSILLDESNDEFSVHPAIADTRIGSVIRQMKTAQILDETVTDIENEIVPSSQTNFLDMEKKQEQIIKSEIHSILPKEKEIEISKWLLNNSPDTQSENSNSIIPESHRDSVSSGNSSLERLETHYETPNNRERIRKNSTKTPGTSKKNLTSAKSIKFHSTQTTLDKYFKNPSQNETPINLKTTVTRKNLDAEMGGITPSNLKTPTNLQVDDYADILDKCYGKQWREKANLLFPTTEIKKPTVTTRDRAVQTERRRPKKKTISNSDEDEFNSFIRQNKPQFNSTQKTQRTSKTQSRDSFINDSSFSDGSNSNNSATFYTALSNSKPSLSNVSKTKPMSEMTRRVIAICDSDSEYENNTNKDFGRRKLLFSEDEDSNNSSTSEYDPDDIVLPKSKTLAKKEVVKQPTKTLVVKKTRPHLDSLSVKKTPKIRGFLSSLSENVPINEVHPDAKKYRLDYKNNKEELCKLLYKMYNENIFEKKLPEDMSIEWNVRMRNTAGFCYNKKTIRALSGVVRSSRIVLATKILDTPGRLRDTLVHELCHAASWLINNIADGHGPIWKAWASKAVKAFPELPPIRRCHDYNIKTKFTYKCTQCGYSIGRHSKSLDIEKKRCGHCYGKFELLVNKVTKSGTVEMKTPSRKEPSQFALFVKENYGSVKKEKNAKHAEVMKILGQQFSAMKVAKQSEIQDQSDSPL